MASVRVHPPLRRQRSEAEIHSCDQVPANTSHHIKHLDTHGNQDHFGEKFHRSLSGGGVPDSDAPIKSTPAPAAVRRVSLSSLEESHYSKAMMSGAFESESEKARKARRKSFDKVRKRSDDERRVSRNERKSSNNNQPVVGEG